MARAVFGVNRTYIHVNALFSQTGFISPHDCLIDGTS
jgi:hypothetical protein